MTEPRKYGRYEVRGILGRGGMSTVLLGYDPSLDREVALKILPPLIPSDTDVFLRRFLREARVVANLDHEAIVPIFDINESHVPPFVVLKLMTGGTLQDRLKRRGGLPAEDVLAIMGRVCPALEAAHDQGIIHRDIKPGNILFDEQERAYLADFGIARIVDHTITSTGVLGTPDYMSPEQINEEDIDARSDIYQLGCVLFHLLTGRVPFPAEKSMAKLLAHVNAETPSVRAINPDLPPEVDHVVQKAMAKERAGRYSTAGELLQAMALALGQPLELSPPLALAGAEIRAAAEPASWVGQGFRQRARRWSIRPFLTIVVVLGLAVLFWSGTTLRGGPGRPAGSEPPSAAQVQATADADVPAAGGFSLVATLTPEPTATTSFQLPTVSPTQTLTPMPTAASTPTPAVEMVFIPAGPFEMGCAADDNLCFSDESPRHTVTLEDYFIDKYEVTNEQYAAFLNSHGDHRNCAGVICVEVQSEDEDSHIILEGETYRVASGFADYPVVELTWYGAVSYCEWAGKRLPSEAEWEKAARGAEADRIFPWEGDTFSCEMANYLDCRAGPAAVGSYPAGASPYGVMDMSGNVWEWVADWYQGDYYERSPGRDPAGPATGEFRVLRGGGWLNEAVHMRVSKRGNGGVPTEPRRSFGFRCAADPEP